MDRLTERAEIDKCPGIWVKEGFANEGSKTWFNGYDEGYAAINKLAEYEDLEEQCIQENSWGLRMLLEKWKEFYEDIQQLYEYRKLEEQGKLLKPPCEVGDTVYVKMQFGGYAEAEVRDFTHFLTCGFCIVVTSDKFDKQNIPFSEIGKTVFLTKEEAEAALKELEEG